MLRKHILRIIVVLAVFAGAAFCSESAQMKRVLVLHSYHATFHWTARIMDGVYSVMEPQDDVEMFVFYMDSKHNADAAYFQMLHELLAYKYRDIQFDAIISSDDHALNFLLQHRDDLFPGVPVFFSGINDFQPALLEGKKDFSGVFETYDVAGTVDLMLKLHPQTRSIVTITDDTVSGQAFRNRIERMEPRFYDRVQFNDLHNPTMDELREGLTQLPEDALVLWAIYIRTPSGVTLSSEASVQMVTDASPVPVYCIWDVVGEGVVGGAVTSPNFQGKVVAEMATKHLRGSSMEDLPISGSPMVYTFDHNVLQRFGISEKELPGDSVILNRPFSVYRAYWKVIWATTFLIILLITIIFFLIRYILLRRRAERKLSMVREQLAQSRKMDAIGQLAGGVAHDFNNVLAGISGAAELLEGNIEGKDHQYITMILSLADRASQLTSKLMAFGRKSSIVLEPTDLNRTLENAIDILKVSLNQSIMIESSIKADSSIVMADESQVTNTLLNMGINAEHAMPDGGTLAFKTSVTTLDKPDCSIAEFKLQPGRFLCITVSDTGEGIAPEHLARIFEPFYTTKAEGKGTGLGLSSVYGSILEHHGAIYVKSKLAKGTEFRMLLPLIESPQAIAAAERLKSKGAGQLIMVVDDEQLIRNTTGKMLTDLNYRILVATNGKEAFDQYISHPGEIALIIMDIVLPEMSGRKAFKQISTIDSHAKVIFTSGFTGAEAIREITANDHVAFLKKPYRAQDLCQAITDMLGNGHTLAAKTGGHK